MITITIEEAGNIGQAQIPSRFGPAFKSAIDEIANTIGERLSGIHKYEKEDALTEAVTALGSFRAALNRVVPEGHPDYE